MTNETKDGLKVFSLFVFIALLITVLIWVLTPDYEYTVRCQSFQDDYPVEVCDNFSSYDNETICQRYDGTRVIYINSSCRVLKKKVKDD